MKKTALLLSFIMVFCLFAVSSSAMDTDKMVITEDFDSGTVNDDYFGLLNDAAIVDGKLTNNPDKALGLMGMYSKYICRSDDYYDIEFDLKSAPATSTSVANTAFVGLRLNSVHQMPTTNEGVWLTFRDNTIGIRTGGWASVTTMTISYSFATERHVYIRDDQEKNAIEIYVKNDKGLKTLVGYVKIEGDSVKLYKTKSSAVPVASNITDAPVPNVGVTKLWCHYNDGVTFDNYKITMRPYTDGKEYTAVSPLIRRDNYSDTWVATDDLERVAPTYETVGAPEDKKVGIFYFLWHVQNEYDPENGLDLYDHYRAYKEGGVSKVLDMMKQGALGFTHYWGEPAFGYYKTQDEWVIRKHASMLSQAGVDFLYFDCTNGSDYYIDSTKAICEVFRRMREEGQDTPQIAFCMGNNNNRTYKQFYEFWNALYGTGVYDDLWFYWEGKPLILCRDNDIPDEYEQYFTRRDCWAFNSWTSAEGGNGRWPWIAEYPQIPGKNQNGEIEQMAVAVASHPNTTIGRSYSGGKQPSSGKTDFEFSLMETTTPRGIFFDEQWGEALRVDPPMVMVTGWNEWWAGRWENNSLSQLYYAGTTIYPNANGVISYYVDAFNPEYSRDIEPMKGGFGDNYYYQMVNYIRQYKGVRPVPKADGQKAINISASFDQWDDVWPEYYDQIYDTQTRDTDSNIGGVYHYTNTTGRNDFDVAKVSKYGNNIYFYARTMEDITAADDNWMYLYIDADRNHETGWEGYDYLINRYRGQDSTRAAVEKNVDGTYKWQGIGYSDIRVEGNEIHIGVDKGLIGNPDTFDFKWADNTENTGDISGFMSYGDVAPDSRFNFRYTSGESAMSFTSETTAAMSDATVMVINKNYSYINGKKTKVDAENTATRPQVIGDKTYVPVRFLAETFGSSVGYNEKSKQATVEYMSEKLTVNTITGDIYTNGVLLEGSKALVIEDRVYMPLRDCSEFLGKTLTWDDRGLIIVGDSEITNSAVLDELFKKI